MTIDPQPIPTRSPETDGPVPNGATVPPGGQTVPPGGQTAPPGGQTAPPGGQTAPPGGQTAPPGGQTAPPLPHHRIRRTRIGGLWVSVAFFAVVLLLLLIFILENGKTVDIAYFGAHGHLPLGVALLLAAVLGVLLVVLAGAARISQLRATARRHRRTDARRLAAAKAAGDPADS
jgi:uncharacterized integral membrane protein